MKRRDTAINETRKKRELNVNIPLCWVFSLMLLMQL